MTRGPEEGGTSSKGGGTLIHILGGVKRLHLEGGVKPWPGKKKNAKAHCPEPRRKQITRRCRGGKKGLPLVTIITGLRVPGWDEGKNRSAVYQEDQVGREKGKRLYDCLTGLLYERSHFGKGEPEKRVRTTQRVHN